MKTLIAAAALMVLGGCAHARVVDSTPGLRTPPGCVFVAGHFGKASHFGCGSHEAPLHPVAEEKLSMLELGRLTVAAWTPPAH